ncbi:chemotaxis response regulator protein-glutamate methylesterase [Acidovorax sp. ACV01]|uniref:protein-glutamate methylesterase/protein-glutamine glutaminase n=1 Tax=Acidovorax sp. ACV01 TaxID=2769311 RepID=UPI001785602B|nr:chemotaxis response regulator protein-glutamate methylesterase [Acidovorax sp. ACV01]MBD9391461.1 chemotaxis response regulator protein-glutamate methylesterase [Acidovorax sp. ACV01]
MKPVRVIIVDDSATVRQVVAAVLGAAQGIEVMAVASDPLFALGKMQRDWPDVVLLDVEMPRMDGITFLKKIMAMRPTPVVICSTLTQAGTATAMEALSAGAVSIVTKPRLGLKQFLLDSGEDIVSAVRAAAQARVRRPLPSAAVAAVPPALPMGPAHDTQMRAMHETTDKVVALGASTGGTQALEAVLSALPRVCPGIVVVQHMPEKFTAAFAARLDAVCEVEVREARSGDRVLPGRVLIAPGGHHMQLVRSGAQYQVAVLDGPPVNRHRPSVDVLFRSVARYAGANALGVLMTGMGDDGARGLKAMRDAGATTLAQDEASSVVYGMPKEAVKLGAAQRSVPLGAISLEVARFGAR